MILLLILALACAVWAITAAITIASELRRRGMPVSYVWLRVMILKYLHEYAKVTQEETGRVGPLFYHYVVPLNAALLLVIITAIIGWP